jgi:nucleoside-diphosphate kinase
MGESLRERTLVLIKPDAVHRGLVGRIISEFEQKAMKIVGFKAVVLSNEQFDFLYSSIATKHFVRQFKHIMQSGPSILIVLEGNAAITAIYNFCGRFNKPEEDLTHSIRQKYSAWTGADVIHRADSAEEAESQIAFFFSKDEILNYVHSMEYFFSLDSYEEQKHHLPPRPGVGQPLG